MKPLFRLKIQKAFSLIELLVTIAIILIISGIIFPALAAAKESSHKTTCISNARQISLGFSLYQNDFDQCFPPTIIPENGWQEIVPNTLYLPQAGPSRYWCLRYDSSVVVSGDVKHGMLSSYADFSAITDCPSVSASIGRFQGAIMSYGYNTNLGGVKNQISAGFMESDLTVPAETILVSETVIPVFNGINWQAYSFYLMNNDSTQGRTQSRHGKKALVLWADGHIDLKSVDYPDRPIGIWPATVFATEHIGDVLKFPRTYLSPVSGRPSISDQYYYLVKKP